MGAPGLVHSGGETWDSTSRNIWNHAVRDLVEIGLVLFCKLRLVRRKFIDGEDRVLPADAGAVSAVDALIGIDEQLGDVPGGRIALQECDGRRGALRCADKVLDTGIG